MSVDAIAPLSTGVLAGLERAPETIAAPGGLTFDGVLAGIEHLNGQLLDQETSIAKLALDPTDSLHHTVIGMERTRLSFELMLAVRNKVLDAYQELMRMQI
jgi:flagellar hook-basal body complex protein FliE